MTFKEFTIRHYTSQQNSFYIYSKSKNKYLHKDGTLHNEISTKETFSDVCNFRVPQPGIFNNHSEVLSALENYRLKMKIEPNKYLGEYNNLQIFEIGNNQPEQKHGNFMILDKTGTIVAFYHNFESVLFHLGEDE